MAATIEIKQTEHEGKPGCYECQWMSICDWIDEIMVDEFPIFRPGPNCPGPGRYRLIDEAKIEEMWKKIDWLPRLSAAHLDAISAAGIKKDERNDDGD